MSRKKTTQQRLAEGSHRPGHHGSPAKEPRMGEELVMPDSLTDPVGVAEWRRVMPILEARGWLDGADAQICAAYCQAVADMAACVRVLKEEGRFTAGSNGQTVAHPAEQMYQRAFARLEKCVRKLGLTPVDRAGQQIEKPGGEEGLDGFLEVVG